MMTLAALEIEFRRDLDFWYPANAAALGFRMLFIGDGFVRLAWFLDSVRFFADRRALGYVRLQMLNGRMLQHALFSIFHFDLLVRLDVQFHMLALFVAVQF